MVGKQLGCLGWRIWEEVEGIGNSLQSYHD
jgi:hypothetical protein